MSQPKAPPKLLDLGDKAYYLRAPAPEKLWIMVFLLAIRDRQERVVLRAEGDEVRLWVEDQTAPRDLAAPKAILVLPMFEFIWRLGLPTKKGPLEMLGVDEIIKPKQLPGAWSSSFRLKLNDGLKQASAAASTEGGIRLLIIELSDVTIPPEDATARLGELTAMREDPKGKRE